MNLPRQDRISLAKALSKYEVERPTGLPIPSRRRREELFPARLSAKVLLSAGARRQPSTAKFVLKHELRRGRAPPSGLRSDFEKRRHHGKATEGSEEKSGSQEKESA
jgi:hypothetical protein